MIGGEYEICIDRLKAVYDKQDWKKKDIASYSSGRAALYHILSFLLKHNRTKRILLPDYLCSSIVTTIKTLGMEYAFYPLTLQLEIDTQKFSVQYSTGDIILFINYFGLKSVQRQIEKVKNIAPDIIVIEDDVQAYFSMFEEEKENVDFCFTSLRKTFAVPDGGLVIGRQKLPEVKAPNTFAQYKIAGGILKSIRKENLYSDELYLQLFEKGEIKIDDNLSSKMSQISFQLFYQTDASRIQVLRERNAKHLYNGLKALGISPLFPLHDGDTPLFVPIYLANRDKVRKYLFAHDVFCPVHWPTDGLPLQKGKEMSEHELSLIVDQRYGLQDMDRILNLLDEVIHEC